MKRFFFRLSIALVTFSISIWITFIYLGFMHIPEVRLASDKEKSLLYTPISNDEVEILYNWESMNWKKGKGNYLITNRTKQSIFYLAYDKSEHFDNWVSQNGKVKMSTEFICLNGRDWQELKANESQMFNINIPRNKNPFEAGFDFLVGEEKRLKTFWVNVNEESNYNPLPQKASLKDCLKRRFLVKKQ